MTEKRREAKGKGEKERYIHLNAEFKQKQGEVRKPSQGISANRGKNRMGKTGDLFEKIRDNKGEFHAKMGTKQGRNGMDLTGTEDIKERWQEYTELCKIDLHDPDNHNGMSTHRKPDILECEVKRALESITMDKTSGGDGIPSDLFQILNNDAV